jgi:hypothetical protein
MPGYDERWIVLHPSVTSVDYLIVRDYARVTEAMDWPTVVVSAFDLARFCGRANAKGFAVALLPVEPS